MERHVLSVMPDRSGWVLVDGGQQVERFRTRQGAIAIGEVKAYKLFQLAGIPSALAVFMDDTTSKIERSEERRVGKACVSTCRSRWSTYHYKKNKPPTTSTVTHVSTSYETIQTLF